MNVPYVLREPPKKMSASTMSSFSDCEARFAYERVCEGVPAVPKPLPMVFGNVIHLFNERLWNNSPEKAEGIKNYGQRVFLPEVLKGTHGAEGEDDAPKSIQWLTRRQEEELAPPEREDKIEELRDRYMGLGWLSLEALYLERIGPSPYKETKVEFNIGDQGVFIKDNHASIRYPVSGYIDRLHFFANGDYLILDLKTGQARKYYGRNKLVRDIQMTVYQLASYRIWKRLPQGMFFVAISEVTKDMLEEAREEIKAERVPETLHKLRIPVEIRKPIHFTNLAQIAADIWTVIRMVIHPEQFEEWEFTDWEPLSDWGKMARFKDNIREQRFVPRIGSWCHYCPFLELCQHDNREDWEQYRKSLSAGAEGSPSEMDSGLSEEPKETFLEPQGTLFETLPRPKALRKSDRELKREMLESGDFQIPRSVFPRLKKLWQSFPSVNGTICPCRRTNVFPSWILDYVVGLLKGTISISEAVKHCPLRECPHREVSSLH